MMPDAEVHCCDSVQTAPANTRQPISDYMAGEARAGNLGLPGVRTLDVHEHLRVQLPRPRLHALLGTHLRQARFLSVSVSHRIDHSS